MPLSIADQDGDGCLQSSEGIHLLRQRHRSQEARLEIQLRPASLPVWRWLDADADDQLSERELRNAADRLRELPAAEQGLVLEVFPDLNQLVLRRRTGVDATANSGRPPGTSDSSTPMWFSQMDLNRDGEVSRREFLGDGELLQRLDRNADGAVQADEIAGDDHEPPPADRNE